MKTLIQCIIASAVSFFVCQWLLATSNVVDDNNIFGIISIAIISVVTGVSIGLFARFIMDEVN